MHKQWLNICAALLVLILHTTGQAALNDPPSTLIYDEDAVYPYHYDIMPACGIFVCWYGYLSLFAKGCSAAAYKVAKSADEEKFPRAFALIRHEMHQAGLNGMNVSFKTTLLTHDWELLKGDHPRHVYVVIPLIALQEIEQMLINHPETPILNKYRFITHCLAHQIRLNHPQKKNIYAARACTWGAAFLTSLFLPALIGLHNTPHYTSVPYILSENDVMVVTSVTKYHYGNQPYWLYGALLVLASGKLITTVADIETDIHNSRQEAIDAVDDALVPSGIAYFEELAARDSINARTATYHAERLKERLAGISTT